MTDIKQLPDRLRRVIAEIRRKPYPIANLIPLLSEAADALQALAQVQGEPFGYIHHYVAHDEHAALIDTTWEADGCADPLPHPTFPSMWKWSHATLFYTTPQPAQATQAEVTDELCWQIWDKAGACDEVNERVTLKVAKPIIRAIVAAYLEVAVPRGIAAQAKKETP